MISGMGRGGSSATRFSTASAEGPKRRPAARHLVQHAAEAEQVGPLVELLPEGLLRGHVHRRAGNKAALRDAGVVGGAGQAEVGDLRLVRPAFEQDVARLDVAVDQVARMGRGQPLGDLPADPQHLGHFERTDPVELLLERLAGDELHRQVGQRLLADLVDLHHVLVPNLRPTNGPRAGSVCARGTGSQSAGPSPSPRPRAATCRRRRGRRCRTRPCRAPGAFRNARSGRGNRAGWTAIGMAGRRRRSRRRLGSRLDQHPTPGWPPFSPAA